MKFNIKTVLRILFVLSCASTLLYGADEAPPGYQPPHGYQPPPVYEAPPVYQPPPVYEAPPVYEDVNDERDEELLGLIRLQEARINDLNAALANAQREELDRTIQKSLITILGIIYGTMSTISNSYLTGPIIFPIGLLTSLIVQDLSRPGEHSRKKTAANFTISFLAGQRVGDLLRRIKF